MSSWPLRVCNGQSLIHKSTIGSKVFFSSCEGSLATSSHFKPQTQTEEETLQKSSSSNVSNANWNCQSNDKVRTFPIVHGSVGTCARSVGIVLLSAEKLSKRLTSSDCGFNSKSQGTEEVKTTRPTEDRQTLTDDELATFPSSLA